MGLYRSAPDESIYHYSRVICHNIEVDLISVHLKGLQSLIEYSKTRSNVILLNYPTEQERNNMPNEVFVPKNSRRGYNNPLRKKNRNKKISLMVTVLNQLRSERKRFNWKTECFFCVEVCVVDKKHPNCSKC